MDRLFEAVDSLNERFECCKVGNLVQLRRYLKDGMCFNLKNLDSRTLLHCAIQYDRIEIVKELLLAGADVNQSDSLGRSILHEATIKGNPEIIQLLLDMGADPSKQYGAGWIPLHMAIELGHLEAVKILIPYSDRSHVLQNGRTILDIAKTEELRDFILNYQDVPEIKEPSDDGGVISIALKIKIEVS